MTICGAKTRQGGGCKQKAGWGTDHVGIGRCKLHGGATPIRTGRYSVVHRQSLQTKIDQFAADPQAGDLRGELALMRALLQDHLDRFPDGVPLTGDDIGRLFDMIEAIGRLVERIAKILATTALTQAELQLIQVALLDALDEFIPDPDQRHRFLARVFGQTRQLLSSAAESDN